MRVRWEEIFPRYGKHTHLSFRKGGRGSEEVDSSAWDFNFLWTWPFTSDKYRITLISSRIDELGRGTAMRRLIKDWMFAVLCEEGQNEEEWMEESVLVDFLKMSTRWALLLTEIWKSKKVIEDPPTSIMNSIEG